MTRDQIKKVQQVLGRLGIYHGRVDGIAGPMTRAAVMAFQEDANIKRDGIVGPITWRALFSNEVDEEYPQPARDKFYLGTALTLTYPQEVDEVADQLGVEHKALRAVVLVEAASASFDARNRPIVLFEPHIAYRLTERGVRNTLLKENLASPRRGLIPYPPTYDARYHQIDRVTEIAGAEVAAMSASWGMGQIMGFNHEAAGYKSAVEMVGAFADSAQNQIAGMAAFIMNNHSLLAALKRKDWDTFAHGYNGPGYASGEYDVKLEEAYRRA